MNMLTVVSLTDNLRLNIEAKLQKINEINSKIERLKDEKKCLLIDADHECDLLEAAIIDPEYKENIVEYVIEKHKMLIDTLRKMRK